MLYDFFHSIINFFTTDKYVRGKIAPSLHSRSTKESSIKSAIKGGGVACSELQLPSILSNFVDHKYQNRLSFEIMHIFGASRNGVRVPVFCRYSSNFTDSKRHSECFGNRHENGFLCASIIMSVKDFGRILLREDES